MMKNRLFVILFFTSAVAVYSTGIDLDTAERLALESSKELIHAREQIELAALQNKLDIRSFLPSFDLSYSSGRQANLHSGDSESIQLGLSITQPLFNGGRGLEGLRLADVRLRMQAASLENSMEELRDSVWGFFYGLLLNEQKMDLQKELLDISVKQLSVTAKKYEMGTLTELDYLEAAIEVREMELDIMDTETETEGLMQDFAVLLGFDHLFFEKNPLELKGSLDREYQGLQLWENDHSIWLQTAATANLKLRGKRIELEQIRTEYELSKRAYIPSISLEVNLVISGTDFPLQQPGGSVSLNFGFPFSPAPSEIGMGGGFQGNDQISRSGSADVSLLPDPGFIADGKSAKLQLRQAAEELESAVTSLNRSVRTALKELEHMRLRLTVRRSTQELQNKRLKILETRNTMGEVTEADLLEARIEFYSGEIGILEEVMELMQTERAFEKLTGTGFGKLEHLCSSIHYGANSLIKDCE